MENETAGPGAEVLIKEELAQIEVHKWLESEKAGHDIGGNQAAWDWMLRHLEPWLKARRA